MLLFAERGILELSLNNDSISFFSKLSKIWQNFKDYNFLKGIELSPEQINIVEQEEDQLLIEGYAGTGKSVTLLYKFINTLIKEEDNQRILYVTFNSTLIQDTRKRLNTSRDYLDHKDRHEVKVVTFHSMATELLKELKVINRGVGNLTVEKVNKYKGDAYTRLTAILLQYKEETSDKYKSLSREERLYKTHDGHFITDEISWMKATGLVTKEKYLNVTRTGRSKSVRLTVNQRNTIFKIFEEYQHNLKYKFGDQLDLEDYALKIVENPFLIEDKYKFDYIYVDEVQDLDPMQVKALCMLTKKSIVLSGDAKQRIYKKSPITYEEIGLRVKEKGKRKTLSKNYRSTAQIVRLANSLNFSDVEDKLEEKAFVKEGSRPIVYMSKDLKTAVKYIGEEIKKIFSQDPRKTIAVVHREEAKAKTGYGKSDFRISLEMRVLLSFSDIKSYGLKFDHEAEKQIFYTNSYDVKGLEFDAVFIIDFNERYYPNSKEIEKIKVDNEGKDIALVKEDIEDFKNREKKLLYVAMTRARENLYIIANSCPQIYNVSEFILDFNYEDYENKGFTKKEVEKLRMHHNFMNREKGAKEKQDIIDESKTIEEIVENKSNDALSKEEIAASTENKSLDTPKIINTEAFIKHKLIPTLTQKGIKVIDKRANGGCLWVLGGKELNSYMAKLKEVGIKFNFSEKGGKVSGHKPSWFYKGV